MSAFEFSAALICDDIRKEVSGKDILIGVYSSDIVLGSFPATIPFAIWIEIYVSEPGAAAVEFRFGLAGREPITLKADLRLEKSGHASIVLPSMQVLIEEEGELYLDAREAKEGADWHPLKRKKVIRGAVVSGFSVSTPASDAPSNN